ncbi:MAG: restriction endonuclease subunit S [Zetaproteobacteria bacterium]|nr:restriction endonuclease subunit S [Zetaproteobacteria bacterium]
MSDFNPEEFVTIPDGWSCKRLADCTIDGNIPYGIVQPGQHVDDGVPVIRVNNVNNGQLELSDVLKVAPEIESKFKRTRLKGGEVLLTLVGTTGQSFVAPNQLKGWNVPRAIAVIRVNETVGADWVNLCLQSKNTKHFLDVRANTTVQKTLNLKDVRDIPIIIPPRDTKEEIESTVFAFSKKIELLRAQNKTLETLAQTIFKEWFVNFNFPNEQGKPYRDSGGEMVDSELGEIPKGWRVGKLEEFASLSAGGDKPKNATDKKTITNQIPIYSNGITNDGLYGYTDTPKVFEESVTVSARGTVGFVCLRDSPYVPIVRLISAVPKNKYLSSKYLFFWLKNKNISGFGTTQEQLTIPVFKKTEIIIPTSGLMDAFTEVVDSFYYKIRNNTSQIKELSNTRDSLLPKLMNGHIRVI